MADEPVAAEPDVPAGTTVLPGGGIVTRTDGSDTPVVTDWRSSLPLELQGDPALAKYKSVEDALRGAVHAQRLIGKASEYPKADAKPEDVAEYRRRAGVPDSPEKYGVTLPQPPQGQIWDKGVVTGFLGAMHAAHARPEVVQAALDQFVTYMAAQADRDKATAANEFHADRAAAVKALEAVWGPQGGPLWEHHNGRALGAIETLMGDAPPEAIQRIKESCKDPEVAHAFSLLADSLLEKGYAGVAEQTAFSGGASAAQAKADAINEAARKDPRHPLMDPTHPDHERVYNEFVALNAMAAGPRGREVVAEVRR